MEQWLKDNLIPIGISVITALAAFVKLLPDILSKLTDLFKAKATATEATANLINAKRGISNKDAEFIIDSDLFEFIENNLIFNELKNVRASIGISNNPNSLDGYLILKDDLMLVMCHNMEVLLAELVTTLNGLSVEKKGKEDSLKAVKTSLYHINRHLLTNIYNNIYTSAVLGTQLSDRDRAAVEQMGKAIHHVLKKDTESLNRTIDYIYDSLLSDDSCVLLEAVLIVYRTYYADLSSKLDSYRCKLMQRLTCEEYKGVRIIKDGVCYVDINKSK